MPAVLVAAACGDEPTEFADAAGGSDGGGDGGGDGGDGGSGTRGPVTVHVLTLDGFAAPDTAATVFFTDAAGTLIESATPDAAGIVTGTAEAGGSVTVRHTASTPERWSTVTGVGIGDDLWFGGQASRGAGQMTVTVPAAAGAARYEVRGPCVSSVQGASTTLTVTLASGCSSTRPLLAIAVSNTLPRRFIVVPAATPASGATLDLTGPWVEGIAGATAEVSGIPAGVTLENAYAVYYADGRTVTSAAAAVTEGQPLGLAFDRPPGLEAGGMTVSLTLRDSDGFSTVARHVEPITAAALAIDATPRLPVVTGLAGTASGVSWTMGAGTADGMKLSLEVPGEKGTTALEWSVYVGPDQDHFVYPRVEGAPAFARPTALLLSEVDLVAGYDSFRRRAGLDEWTYWAPVPVPAAYTQHLRYVAPDPFTDE